jgi:hypothetical protein
MSSTTYYGFILERDTMVPSSFLVPTNAAIAGRPAPAARRSTYIILLLHPVHRRPPLDLQQKVLLHTVSMRLTSYDSTSGEGGTELLGNSVSLY